MDADPTGLFVVSQPSVEKERRNLVFPGGGEMAELMRRKDWSQTPFGAIADWPQSLKTATALMLESSFAMVVAWGPEFRFLYNDRYRPVLGSKHPFALGAAARDIFPEVWDDLIGPLFQRTRCGEAVGIDDLLIPLHRHGYLENCYFTIAYSPIRDESGGIGGMLAVVAETTERVEGERRLTTLRDLAQRATEAKTAEEACVNAAAVLGRNPIDVPFAWFYLLDADGSRARWVASSGSDASGAGAPRVIEVTSEGDAGWPVREALQFDRSVVLRDVIERVGELPSGPFPEAVHTALLLPLARPGVAQPYGFLVAAVSARRELNERYRDFLELTAEHVTTAISNARAFAEERRRADALAEIDRAKTAFFSNVSHEFRTPLTLMLGPMEELLVARRTSLPEDVRQQLEVSHRNSLRLLKLVNTLLDFSRLEAGRTRVVYEPVNLAVFTNELAGVFRSAIEKAGLELRVDCAPVDEPAYVDRDMWEKIVFNLLSNALKFTLEGRIDVRLHRRGDAFVLEVVDTGVGIPASELPNLFKRFYRVENPRSRTHEGTGIGLALVQELVRLHGGNVEVESRIGESSTFRVIIPAGRTHLPQMRVREGPARISTRIAASSFLEEALRWLPDENAGQVQEDATIVVTGEAGTMVDGPAARILLADDNADMRDYVRRLLGASYTIEAVSDGEAALAAIRHHRPDLVLTDVMMPRLDGLGLLQAIRANSEWRTIPVILLLARAGDEASVEGYDAGADDYLIKPFTARELLSRVASHLAMARLRNEVVQQTRRVENTEARSEQLMRIMPLGVCVCDRAGRITFHNQRLVELLACTPGAGEPWVEFISRCELEWPEGVQLENAPSAPLTRAVLEGRSANGLEFAVAREDGIRSTLSATIQPIREVDGGTSGVILAVVDLTERKRAERHTLVLGRLSQELAPLTSEREIIAAAARIIGQHLAVRHCCFLEARAQDRVAVVAYDWRADASAPSLEGVHDLEHFGPQELSQLLGSQSVAVADTRKDPLTRKHAASYEALGVRAWLTAPFMRHGGPTIALVAVQNTPREWRSDERSLLEAALARVWPIVERERANTKLQDELARTKETELASRRLAAIVESSDDAIIGKSLEGTIETWNEGAQRIFGYTAEEVVGRLVTILIPADRQAEEPAILARIRNGERVNHYETVRRRKDGTLIDVSLTISPIRDRAGNVIGASKIARDVTARRRAEAQQSALYEMLARVNRAAALPEVYEATLNAITRTLNADRASILLLNSDRTMRFVAWRGLSQAYRSAVEGHLPWTKDRNLEPITIEDVHEAELEPQLRADVMREGIRALAFIPLTYESRLMGKFMVYYDSPHRFSADELQLAQVIATQVAFAIERQRDAEALEALVNERTASLRQAVWQMEEFSYSVSHDLRSPVRAMQGYAEVILEEYGSRLDSEGRELLERIKRNGQRMDRLIQDLLTYSRISRREIQLEPVVLDRLVREIVQQYPEMRPERADIIIVGSLPCVMAHEPSLTQVISNLLSNAVKFVAPHTRPRVRIGHERTGGAVRVWFEDNGIGIRPEHQNRLFGMFERLHPELPYEGTGIGLAIVRRAMERMHGRVGMHSDGVSGSCFWIEFLADSQP